MCCQLHHTLPEYCSSAVTSINQSYQAVSQISSCCRNYTLPCCEVIMHDLSSRYLLLVLMMFWCYTHTHTCTHTHTHTHTNTHHHHHNHCQSSVINFLIKKKKNHTKSIHTFFTHHQHPLHQQSVDDSGHIGTKDDERGHEGQDENKDHDAEMPLQRQVEQTSLLPSRRHQAQQGDQRQDLIDRGDTKLLSEPYLTNWEVAVNV